ncbi:hypothetical protein Gorai_019514 [Gossypium raimondii]|uniref:Uncharacterized protein n=1 Tax=Gossypium raimondii TaxID=29730 RepID=A0A7J8PPM5_GOSRA|nr:hypothetical protein [Gossypium raimondii]
MANLNLADKEEEAFQEENSRLKKTFDFVCIDLVEKRYLFKSFYKVDLNKIHDLPPGLMSETMAGRFGTFLGDFLIYDTKVPPLGVKRYMRLKPVFFICGRLGHGESFYPVRVRVDLTQIVFGWDITLRAPIRRGPMGVNRWLRESDEMRS